MRRSVGWLMLVGCVPGTNLNIEELPPADTVIIERASAPPFVVDRRRNPELSFLAEPVRAWLYQAPVEDLQLQPGAQPELLEGGRRIAPTQVLSAVRESGQITWVPFMSDTVQPPMVTPLDPTGCTASGRCLREGRCRAEACDPEAPEAPERPSLYRGGACAAPVEVQLEPDECPPLMGPFGPDGACVTIGSCSGGGVNDLAQALQAAGPGETIELAAGTFAWPTETPVEPGVRVLGRCPADTRVTGAVRGEVELSNLTVASATLTDGVTLRQVEVVDWIRSTGQVGLAQVVFRDGLLVTGGTTTATSVAAYGRGIGCANGRFLARDLVVQAKDADGVTIAPDCELRARASVFATDGERTLVLGGQSDLESVTIHSGAAAGAIILAKAFLQRVAVRGGENGIHVTDGLEPQTIMVGLQEVLIEGAKNGIVSSFDQGDLELNLSEILIRGHHFGISFQDENQRAGAPIDINANDLCIVDAGESPTEPRAITLESPVGGNLERIWVEKSGAARFESDRMMTVDDLTLMRPGDNSLELKGRLTLNRVLIVADEDPALALVRTGHDQAAPFEVLVVNLEVVASPVVRDGVVISGPLQIDRMRLGGMSAAIWLTEEERIYGDELILRNTVLRDTVVGVLHDFSRDPVLDFVHFEDVSRPFSKTR